MATLSAKSTNTLIDAVASAPCAKALLAAIAARAPLDAKNQVVLADALTSQLHGKAKKQSEVDEILAAVVSGAALSLGAKRRIIEMMAGATSGNELINVIQSTPTAPIKL
jgi:hypothetical protein